MNTQGIQWAGIRIAQNLIELARSVMDDDAVGVNVKIGRNTLTDSALKEQIEGHVKAQDDLVVTLLFNHYVTYLEWDRPAKYGKQPPIDALKDWAEKNGIPTDASTLWSISYAIWRDGHVGRPIFATLDKLLDEAFGDNWAPQIFDALVEELDNFFNQ